MIQTKNLQTDNVLTHRENEVLMLIGLGLPYTQISEKLCIKPTTVSKYRGRILKKMHLNSTNDIIRYLIENDIIS